MPPKPSPPTKSSGSGVLYTFGAIALVGSATLGYAKYDPEFRKSLVEYVPFTDNIIKFIFQEDASTFSGLYEDLKKSWFGSSIGEEQKSQKKPVVKEISPYKGKICCF